MQACMQASVHKCAQPHNSFILELHILAAYSEGEEAFLHDAQDLLASAVGRSCVTESRGVGEESAVRKERRTAPRQVGRVNWVPEDRGVTGGLLQCLPAHSGLQHTCGSTA